MISLSEALELIKSFLKPLPPIKKPVFEAEGHVLAEDIYALLDVPGRDVSLKDGYAVISEDIASASPENPVPLEILGESFAGEESNLSVRPGSCVRLTAGALLPQGATAVLAEEFVREEGSRILALADAPFGKNVLRRGTDISRGALLVARGNPLFPPEVGLISAAGHAEVLVYPRPRVFLLATGDEIVAPGHPLKAGQIFASNLVTLASWCQHFGFEYRARVEKDEKDLLKKALIDFYESPFEVLITSGGAWKGPKDLIVNLLDELGWKKIFHRVRMGPGKAVAFGLWGPKIVFCLPGGPPSNQMAFLNLALPGLFLLSGAREGPFPTLKVRLSKGLSGQKGWTQLFFGKISLREGELYFEPVPFKSRLSYLAEGEALALLEEDKDELKEGETVCVRLLKPLFQCRFI